MKIVKVYLPNAPFHLDKAYDYLCPDGLNPVRGQLALVPFGVMNRCEFGIIDEVVNGDLRTETDEGYPLKEIYDLQSTEYSLSEEMLECAKFISENCLCTIGCAVRSMLPPQLLGAYRTEYERIADYTGKSKKAYELSEKLSLGKTDEKEIERNGYGGALAALKKAGCVRMICTAERPRNILEKRTVSLCDTATEINLRGEKQRAVVSYLAKFGKTDADILREKLGITAAQLEILVAKKVIRTESYEVYRNTNVYGKGDRREIILNREQTEADERLEKLYRDNKPAAALLFGVTGSGKTKVIMNTLDRVIDEGHGAILLVPEISLTPQFIGIFCSRYGDRTAVIHSSLSQGERFDAYRRIARGEVDLVIGTRSAIFAPVHDLALIVIDEEHEHTYKSDMDPKYHARDVAAFRCKYNNALLISASATPSIESFYKANNGTYELIRLKERYGGAKLPCAHVVDMRQELAGGNTSPISNILYEKMNERMERGEQTILFLNRRGYNASLHCRECGYVFECPRCSVAMTHHLSETGSYLACHLCGYRTRSEHKCPQCGSKDISYIGVGTQKAEAEVNRIFPEMSVARMDADTTSTKSAYENILGDFRDGKNDVLLGTQMVTKGHDFRNVTLVGVLSADVSLYVNDFRGAERTFELLTQVIGRAGRGNVPGEAVIQTFSPDNEIIKLACSQDYEAFYRKEIEKRKEFLFPPFCSIVTLTLTVSDEKKLGDECKKLSDIIRKTAEGSTLPLVIFGPYEPPVYKANGKFRMKTLIKSKNCATLRQMIRDILLRFRSEKNVSLTADINPTDT